MPYSRRAITALSTAFVALACAVLIVLPARAEFCGLVVRDFYMLPSGVYSDAPDEVREVELEAGRMVGASGYVRSVRGYTFDRCEPDGIAAASQGGTEINIYYKTNTYLVSYSYAGAPPPLAPALPAAAAAPYGAQVEVAAPPTLAGYDFSGWSTPKLRVEDDAFSMPDYRVEFTGYFSAQSHALSYSLVGEPPADARAPEGGSYYTDDTVIPADEPAPVIGYTFMGWRRADAPQAGALADGFAMPAYDLELVGAYVRDCYALRYEYAGEAPALPPSEESWHYGDAVAPARPSPVAGWLFMGWHSGDAAFSAGGFAMPPHAVCVVGEWLRISEWKVMGVDAEYDGAPHCLSLYAPNMPADSVIEVGLGGEWRAIGEGFTDVIDADALVRVSLDGRTLAELSATVRVRPRSLSLQMPSGEAAYTGAEQSLPVALDALNAQVVGSGLVNGDAITGLTLAEYEGDEGRRRACSLRTDAGEWEIAAERAVITRNGLDVTSNYDISLLPGVFTIHPMEAVVDVKPMVAVYTGAALAFDPEVAVTGLNGAAIRSLKLSYRFGGEDIAGELPYINEAGSYTMTVLVASDDPNYSFRPEGYEATLHIAKARITAVSRADDAIYDGMPHGVTGLTIVADGESVLTGGVELPNPGLAAWHSVAVEDGESFINVGFYEGLRPRRVTVWEGERDVTANYDIRMETASMTISKRTLRASVDSVQKRYDGLPISVGWKVEETSRDEGLVVGHELRGILTNGTRTVVGSDAATLRAYVIYDRSGLDVTGNYTLIAAPGSITVTPRALSLTLSDESRVYDGQPLHVICEVAAGAEGEGLAKGDTLAPVLAGDGRVHVGFNAVVFSSALITTPDGTDVSACYNIICKSGSLTVTPRPIRVLIGSSRKPYDGDPLRASWAVDWALSELNMGIAEGDTPYVSMDVPERAEIGLNEVTLTAFGAAGADGSDRSGDYSVTYKPGQLEITPVTTAYTVRYIYDGEIDARQTVELAGCVGDVVSAYPPKPRAGSRLDYVSGVPLTLNLDSDSNLIDVFYYSYTHPALESPDASRPAAVGISAE